MSTDEPRQGRIIELTGIVHGQSAVTHQAAPVAAGQLEALSIEMLIRLVAGLGDALNDFERSFVERMACKPIADVSAGERRLLIRIYLERGVPSGNAEP